MIQRLMELGAPTKLASLCSDVQKSAALIKADVYLGQRDKAQGELATLRGLLNEARELARQVESELGTREAPPW